MSYWRPRSGHLDGRTKCAAAGNTTRIPPEFFERHRRSSGNTFDYALKKHFLVLEVASDATRQQVLNAWRRLARRHHPDAAGGDEERMKAINLAKERIFRIKRWD